MGEVCPQCKGRRFVTGDVHGLLPMNALVPWVGFRPHGLRWLSIVGRDLSLDDRFRACLDCGLVWSHVRAQQLTRIILERGRPQLKQQLGL
jgi:hypothetical protein